MDVGGPEELQNFFNNIEIFFKIPELSVRNANAKPTPIWGTISRSFSDKPPGFPIDEPGLFG